MTTYHDSVAPPDDMCSSSTLGGGDAYGLRTMATLLTAGAVMGCTACNESAIDCMPRKLESREVAVETFVGAWRDCPTWGDDLIGPEEIFCDFHANGEWTWVWAYEDGGVQRKSSDRYWDLDVEGEVHFLVLRGSEAIFSRWEISEIGEDFIRVDASMYGNGRRWDAVSCTHPEL